MGERISTSVEFKNGFGNPFTHGLTIYYLIYGIKMP